MFAWTPLLSAAHLALLVIHFVLGPIALKVGMRRVLASLHPQLKPKDLSMLSQRATRAFVATSLLLGAASSFPHQWAQNVFIGSCGTAQYLMLGTVLYYVMDCVTLVLQRDFDATMWLHHLSAIGMFSTFLHTGHGHGGGMYVLLSEGLVPWGFALFYLKRTGKEDTMLFRAVTVGGFCFILFRAGIWALMSLALLKDYHVVPLWFAGLIASAACVGFYMEYVWGSLYWKNIKRAFGKSSRKKGN